VILLGFDTATAATAVALRLPGRSTLQARDDPRPGEHPGHATRLLGMARELLAAAGVGWRELDRIAVGVGPGTFTGLRVGVATARGLAQSLACELVGVSSPRALAAPAIAQAPGRPVLAVIDARRGEVFVGLYREGGQGGPRELAAPRPLAPEELVSALVPDAAPGAAREGCLAVGDGAVRYRGHLVSLGVEVPPEGSTLHAISAEAVCELGAAAAPAADLRVLPDYRRRPDAEIALESRAETGPADALAVSARGAVSDG
jgi:tRNA threonylcarbamoyladenosine biosynthesis protein TsaB